MRALLQRVRRASVYVDDQAIAEIGPGLLVFLGIHPHDDRNIARWLSDKVLNLRIFDEHGKMNRNVVDVKGGVLVVSQFTLYSDALAGRRPNFALAAGRELAEPIYDYFVDLCRVKAERVETGRFGAKMDVALVNDGPVTIWIDSANRKREREQEGHVDHASGTSASARHPRHFNPRLRSDGKTPPNRH